jgi:hypothetical protein
MRPITVTKTLVAGSVNAIALAQTPVSGTPLTLNGATVTGGVARLDSQRRVLLSYGNEVAGRTLTLTGTGDSGTPISEVLTIPSGATGTISSRFDYLTLTSALPLGGGWTASAALGTSNIGATPWFIPDINIAPFSIAIGTVLMSGTPTWSIELPYEDPRAPPPLWGQTQQPAVPPDVYPLSGITDVSANVTASIAPVPVLGWRLTVNGAGSVKAIATQSGMTSP